MAWIKIPDNLVTVNIAAGPLYWDGKCLSAYSPDDKITFTEPAEPADDNPTPSKMVERLAQILVRYSLGVFEERFRDDNGRPLNPPFTPNATCIAAVRAMLSGMREPTEAMLGAVTAPAGIDNREWREHARNDWLIMIDAALKE